MNKFLSLSSKKNNFVISSSAFFPIASNSKIPFISTISATIRHSSSFSEKGLFFPPFFFSPWFYSCFFFLLFDFTSFFSLIKTDLNNYSNKTPNKDILASIKSEGLDSKLVCFFLLKKKKKFKKKKISVFEFFVCF